MNKVLVKIVMSLWMLAPIGLVCMVITGISGYYPSPLYDFFGAMMLCGFGIIFVSLIVHGIYSIWTGGD